MQGFSLNRESNKVVRISVDLAAFDDDDDDDDEDEDDKVSKSERLLAPRGLAR